MLTLLLASCGEQKSTSTSSSDTTGSNNTSDTTTTSPNPVEPELKNMDYYFSGIKTEYLKSDITDENGNLKTFNELLDRQIDVLAQDLIYRLTYVYGYNEFGHNRNNANLDIMNNNEKYLYSGNKAIVNSNSIITYVDINKDRLVEVDLSSPNDFQHSIMISDRILNYLLRETAFYLGGSIEGRYMTIVDDGIGNKVLSESNNFNKSWIMYSTPSNYESYYMHNSQEIKLGIAQILANNENLTNYEELLNSINYLGFNENHKEKLIDYIFNSIIGETLVSNDKEYEKYFMDVHGGIIKSDAVISINNDSSFTNEDNPRLYKGYNIVIPAIVEQALNNTFENTDTSIYPTLSRMAVESSNNVNGFNESKNYSSILLMPKEDTPTTKLVVNFEGVGESIGKTIDVKYIVSNASKVYEGTTSVTLDNVSQEVELNLNEITSGQVLNAYNGNSENYTSTNLFGGNDERISINDGDCYIKLIFDNQDNVSFKVTFRGMYDRV